jgi:hypothetical protein
MANIYMNTYSMYKYRTKNNSRFSDNKIKTELYTCDGKCVPVGSKITSGIIRSFVNTIENLEM